MTVMPMLWLTLSALLVTTFNHGIVSAFVPGSRSLSTSSGRMTAISTSSFVAHGRRQGVTFSSRSSSSSSSMSMNMFMDRMSDECLEAMTESHMIGNDIGLKVVNIEILFAGIVAKPERAAQTLADFEIQYSAVRQAAVMTIRKKSIMELNGNDSTDPLPFSEQSKLVLEKACTIADNMESKLVRSEHVLLALMGYNNGNKIESAPVVEVLANVQGLATRKYDQKFSVFTFCQELVNSLPDTPFNGKNEREQVAIGGAEGSTNTLSEVGVDLTQMALEGKLDAVYGRDAEIRSALRTLGRRRKNNPCLIGEPGV
jgi:ATP-dependent Clp protease ATP-binding subunit ClpC